MKKIYLIVCFLALISCSTEEFESREESIEESLNAPYTQEKGKVKTINYLGSPAAVYELGDKYYFQGDVILDKKKIDSVNSLPSKGAVFGINKWPPSYNDYYKIPYVLSDDLIESQRVYTAIDSFQKNTFVRFVPRTNQTDYIKIINVPNTQKSYSNGIGRLGGEQIIGLRPSATYGNVMHELGHAIGLFHEHTREDRDSVITIWWDNMSSPSDSLQYVIYSERNAYSSGGYDVGEFDFNSIMMYSSGFPPKMYRNVPPYSFSAQRDSLSSGDVEAVNTLYPKPSPKVILDVTAVHNYSQSKVIDYVYETKWFDSAIQSVEWSGKSEHSPQYYWISNNESTSLILVPSTSGSHYHFMKVKLTTEDGNSYTSGASFYTYEKYTIMALMPPGDPSDPM